MAYFYPRPPRGGRQRAGEPFLLLPEISIHALREEGDTFRWEAKVYEQDFYPRPPRGGRRLQDHHHAALVAISIHALREEGDSTIQHSVHPLSQEFLSTPSARRATKRLAVLGNHGRYFYPRPPRGGRPGTDADTITFDIISIHALREEGDSKNRDKISIFL